MCLVMFPLLCIGYDKLCYRKNRDSQPIKRYLHQRRFREITNDEYLIEAELK